MTVNKIVTQMRSILLLNPYKPCYCSANCIFFGVDVDDFCYGEVIAVEECYIDDKHWWRNATHLTYL